MDIIIDVLICLHLLGLVIGLGAGVALSVIGPHFGVARDGERSALSKIGTTFIRNGNIGLGLLWVTGILIVFLKFGGVGAMSPWFWAKMVLVVFLSATIGIGSAAYRRFQAGDIAASGRAALMGNLTKVLGVLVILCAVFAFG